MQHKLICLFLAVFMTSTSLRAETPPSSEKVIVFDFGGVIGSSNKKALSSYIQDHFKISNEEAVQIQKDSEAARKEKIPASVFWQGCAKKHNVALPSDWDVCCEDVRLCALTEIKGMRALVRAYKSKGYRLALLSNVTPIRADYLRKLGYYDDFSPVLLSCEIGVDKPDPQAYRILLDRLQTAPKNCIFIDDKQENIDAAKALGMDGIVFASAEQIQAELEKRLK